MGQIVVVRTDDGKTPLIVVDRGTKHGYPLFLLLFNIYSIRDGEKIEGILVKKIRFADDKCVIATDIKVYKG